LGPYGISVNCVAPGMMKERPGAAPDPERARDQADQWIPFKRVGRGEDIAAAGRFFCLPESECTTGPTLLVTGATRCTSPAISAGFAAADLERLSGGGRLFNSSPPAPLHRSNASESERTRQRWRGEGNSIETGSSPAACFRPLDSGYCK